MTDHRDEKPNGHPKAVAGNLIENPVDLVKFEVLDRSSHCPSYISVLSVSPKFLKFLLHPHVSFISHRKLENRHKLGK